MEEKEVTLIDLLNVLWKKKWIILALTFFLIILAQIVIFFIPRTWETHCFLLPGRIFIQTSGGQLVEFLLDDPKQIAEQINGGSYNNFMRQDLNLNTIGIPRIRASIIRDTNLIKISTRNTDKVLAKNVLNSLFLILKKELDSKIEVEMKAIESQIDDNEKNAEELNILIRSKEIQKTQVREEIKAEQNLLTISRERFKNILDEMKAVKQRIDEIEKQQRKALKEQREGIDALSLLLYSNEIQTNLRYYNTLDEKLSIEKITQENSKLSISGKEQKIKLLDTEIETQNNEIEKIKNQIDLLNIQKGRIDFTKLTKMPTSPRDSVLPKRKNILYTTGILGLFLSIILVFFIDYIEKQKK